MFTTPAGTREDLLFTNSARAVPGVPGAVEPAIAHVVSPTTSGARDAGRHAHSELECLF